MTYSSLFALPPGAWRGSDYVQSLRDGRGVFYDGERIDVTRHPSFAGLLSSLAAMYDRQHEPAFRDDMLWRSGDTGNLVSYSYLAPRTRADLDRKWRNSQLWMRHTNGQLPRVPDFMANVVVGLYDFRGELGKVNPVFAANAAAYYHYCREHDICLTHALGDPQIDRSSSPAEHPELALRVVERRDDGIVVRGAKQLASLAPFAHEVLVYLSPANYLRENPDYVAWFAVPLAAPGLTVLCREAHGPCGTGFDHRLASRYDEQDAMLFFDDVFVPIERVFLLEDTATAVRGFHEINKWSLYVGQIRFYHRLRAFLGVASLIAKSIGVEDFREVLDRLGELTSYVELVRLGLAALNEESAPTATGHLAPGPTLALDALAAQVAVRVPAIIRRIAASGLVMQPSERDLASPELRPLLETYMRGKDVTVDVKSRLFRLAYELVADRYGMRLELYEMWHRGDVVNTHAALYRSYPERAACEDAIRQMIAPELAASNGAKGVVNV